MVAGRKDIDKANGDRYAREETFLARDHYRHQKQKILFNRNRNS